MRRIFALIPKQYRANCMKMIAMVPVRAILNLIGVAVLVPVMMLLMDKDKFESSFLYKIYESFGFESMSAFTLAVLSAAIAILIVKSLLCIFLNRQQNRYLNELYRYFSLTLYDSFYSRGLQFMKHHNSMRMSYNVIGVCGNFVMGYLGGWLGLAGDLVFVVLVFASLFIYSPMTTTLALCAFIPAFLIYVFFIRKPLEEMAGKKNEMNRELTRLVSESFRGYTEVQINNAYPFIRKRLSTYLSDIAGIGIKSATVRNLPSYMMELSVVIVVAAMLYFSLNVFQNADLVMLGIFAVAMMRLLPTIKTIMGSMSAISETKYSLEIISKIEEPTEFYLNKNDDTIVPMTFGDSIKVDDVTFRFDDGDKDVIEHLNLEIKKGESICIKGRTGCGKTTLFNLLLGFYFPQQGRVLVDGVRLSHGNAASWQKIVGYVPQEIFVSADSVAQNIAFGIPPEKIDRELVREALEKASLWDFVQSLPQGMDSFIGEFGSKMSGGERQRLGIARALYRRPEVLFFDEATSALDSKTEKDVNDAILALSERDKSITIIIISHKDGIFTSCDRTLSLYD